MEMLATRNICTSAVNLIIKPQPNGEMVEKTVGRCVGDTAINLIRNPQLCCANVSYGIKGEMGEETVREGVGNL